MGSFNVGCGISNLSIEMGDDIGFLILTKGTGNERRAPDMGTATFIYGDEMFKPYAPPVFGHYGDYGIVEAIEKSKTTEFLEKKFSRPIENIIECITCGGGPYDSGRIYDNYFTGSKKFREFGVSHEVALTELGFTKMPSGKNEEIYRLAGADIVIRPSEQHEMLSVWSIWSAEKDDTVLVPEFISQFSSMALEKFSQVTGVFPGYEEKDYEAIQALAGFYGMYFLKDTLTGMKAHLAKNDYFFPDEKAGYEKMWKEFCAAQLVIKRNPEESWELTKLPYMQLGQFIERRTGFPLESIMELSAYEDSYEFVELGYFMSVMATVNRMFMPSYCGTQDGDTDASLALNEITSKVLKARKKEYDQYND